MEKSSRILLVIFIVLILLLAAGIVYFFQSGAASEAGIKFLEPSSDLMVSVEVPPVVEAGVDFRLVVNVQNDGQAYLTLKEIILPGSILDHVSLVDVFPKPVSQFQHSYSTGFQVDYYLAPGAVLDFVFNLRAIDAVNLNGKIEVVADSFRGSTIARIKVIEKETALPPTLEVLPTETLVEKIPLQSVVKITAMSNKEGVLTPLWNGSGTIVSTDGLVLTSAHAVLPQKNYQVDSIVISIASKSDIPTVDTFFATVVQADPYLDLAVILITSDMLRNPVIRQNLHLNPAVFGDAAKMNRGDRINILGYPQPGDYPITIQDVTVNDISLDPANNQAEFIHLSAYVPGGYSGGLAADVAGSLVGIPTINASLGEEQTGTCVPTLDSNRDGVIDPQDSCAPTGNALHLLRPIQLAIPLIEAAQRGEVNLSRTVSQDIVPAGKNTLFQYDFSNPDSGWTTFDNDNGWGNYVDHDYRILVKQENKVLWSLAQKKFGDQVIQVSMNVQSPTGSGDAGVLCRYQNPGNYYIFSVSEDGYFGIFKKVNEEFSPLIDWTFSPAITWYNPLKLTAVCDGETLTLGVDGKILGQVADNNLQEGDIGLQAGSWEQPGFGISFDNLEVKTPK
jgi:S1-C subfamily serine protease